MQRKKLLALPIAKTRNDVPNVPEKENYSTILCYDARLDNSTGEEVLIVDFYRPQKNTFVKRLFFDGDKWFTLRTDGKISEESLLIKNGYYYSPYKYIPFAEESSKLIKSYVKGLDITSYDRVNCGNSIEALSDCQDKIRQTRIDAKYRRIKESITREMFEIRPTPKKFIKWVDDVVMPKYLFYIYSGKKRTEAHCSHCGEKVEIDSPHRGDILKCPSCKKICTAKPLRAYLNTNGFNDTATAEYIQPMKNNRFCIREYEVTFRYSYGRTVPKKDYFEYSRSMAKIQDNTFKKERAYEYDPDYKGGNWRSLGYSTSNYKSNVYPATLNKLFKNREGFNQYHLDYNKIVRICNPVDIKKVFYASVHINSLTNLINAGLINLAKDVIDYDDLDETINISAGSLKKSFGITKDDLPVIQYINPTYQQFMAYLKYKSSKRKICKGELKEYFSICTKLGNNNLIKLTNVIIKYSSLHQFIKFYNRLESENFFTPENMCRSYYWGDPHNYFLLDYFDYLEFAKLLEYDLRDPNVLYPKNPKKAHDDLSEIINSKEFREGELPQIARQFKPYNEMFGFEADGLLIVPPTRHNDVKNEGKKLKHCVSTYAKRIAMEQTIILFIRKTDKPDKPYFTLNIEPETYRMIQCRGLENCAYPTKVKKFIDKWYKEKIEPLKRSTQLCQKIAS